jgi:hypothetical protein
MGSNIQNLNYVLDDTLSYVFGSEFQAAATRAASFKADSTIVLDQAVIEKLFLGNVLENGDHVGKAELDIIFGSLHAIKSIIEWITAYDLDMERSLFRIWSYNNLSPTHGTFWKVFPGLWDFLERDYLSEEQRENNPHLADGKTDKDLLNDLVFFFLDELDTYFKEGYPNPQFKSSSIPGMLPLRNNFLKTRSGASGRLGNSKADLIKAIDYFSSAYKYYFTPSAQIPQGVRDEILTNYGWIGDCLSKLKTAVQQGSEFYYPDELPKGVTVWNYTSSAENGINFGKLFTPGQLSLNKLIVTEADGRTPQFFGWKTNSAGGNGTAITTRAGFAQYTHIGFQFDLTALDEVFAGKLKKDGIHYTGKQWVKTLYPNILLTPQNGELLYNFYKGLYSYSE